MKGKDYPLTKPILKARVATPMHGLVGRQLPRSLGLKEEQTLIKSIAVVEFRCSGRDRLQPLRANKKKNYKDVGED